MKRSGNMQMKLAIAVAIIIILLAVPFAIYQIYINNPVNRSLTSYDINIKKDTNKNILIRDLNKEGLIKNKLFAKIYLRDISSDKTFKAGHYKLNTSMTPKEILEKIVSSQIDSEYVTVTIPEGYTIKQIASRLKDKALISSTKEFIDKCSSSDFSFTFLEDIKTKRVARLEGYLFPATYEFKKGMSSSEIIEVLLKRFDKVYKEVILPRIGDKNIDDVMKLASIVEKEAKLKEEQSVISAVFLNRVKSNMRLQSCATVQYALGKHKEVLSTKDTKIESLYNTYKYLGLPVGPICNPGEPAIIAALEPKEVGYLFFVLNYNKNDGSHYFTDNYKDFLKYKKLK